MNLLRPGQPTLVIAHRGASRDVVDNSLDAFRRAIELGADMLEFDVRRTHDHSLIAFHDASVRGIPVARLDRAQITKLTRHQPPLLEEILDLAAGQVGLDVELKELGYVEEVVAQLGRRFGPERLVLTSFHDHVVAQVKQRAPELTAGLLLGLAPPTPHLPARPSELRSIARADRCGADFVAVQLALARIGVLRRAQEAGYPAFVWTVNDDAAIAAVLRDPRVAGVITDVPGRALELRAELTAATDVDSACR